MFLLTGVTSPLCCVGLLYAPVKSNFMRCQQLRRADKIPQPNKLLSALFRWTRLAAWAAIII
jgi:hypothetical protein